MSRLTALFGLLLMSCRSGLPAEHPLTVQLGLERNAADGALKNHQYCIKVDGPRPDVETYPRCDRAGFEWGESWVMATYKDNRLVELRRYERIADSARATERWNQLIGERAKSGAVASDEATAAIRTRPLEAGTKTVKAFRVDANTVVGVYLLTPAPPEEANILEAVLLIPKS
jgi:hypothetical protein